MSQKSTCVLNSCMIAGYATVLDYNQSCFVFLCVDQVKFALMDYLLLDGNEI